MQWSKEGAHVLLQTRVRTLNGELGAIFKHWYPDMDLEVEESSVEACPPASPYSRADPAHAPAPAGGIRRGRMEPFPLLKIAKALDGPACAFEQKITVPHNPLSNSLLCGDECELQHHWENHTQAVE
jgi:hypothetical protein